MSSVNWSLLENNWFRLILIDWVEVAQLRQKRPTAEEIYSAVREQLQQRKACQLLIDFELALTQSADLDFSKVGDQVLGSNLRWLTQPVPFRRILRYYRWAGCNVPPDYLESELIDRITTAAHQQKYPEKELLAYCQRHPVSSDLWRFADRYPQVLQWALLQAKPNDHQILSILARIIEHNFTTYPILKQWLLDDSWQNKGYFLLLRPYLLKDVNLALLDNLRATFGLDDSELRLGKISLAYNKPNPLTPNYYFGYRQAWHFLEYAPKDQRSLLLQKWQGEDGFDCSYAGFVDWINFKKGNAILSHSNVQSESTILALMAEID